MNFDHYFTNEEIEEKLHEWAKKYPNLVKVVTIGETYEKRPLRLLVITNQDTGPDTSKPAVWLDGNIHSAEITGSVVALRVASALLEGYGQQEQITRQLDRGVYYILPRVNPDGAALAMADIPRFVRSGVRSYPYPEIDDGLHVEDIDRDGHILQMRIKDPNGDWKVSTLDGRMLEKRAPNEFGGEYYRMLPEGRIENFDGYQIKIAAPVAGLDHNRNFPISWRVESEQPGAGPYPLSEPEPRAIADFIISHPNINIAQSYHTFCGAILRSYAYKSDDEMEVQDLWVFKKIGNIGTKLTGYRNISIFHDFKYHPKQILTGGYLDWLFENLGIFGFATELWALPDMAGIKDPKYIEWDRDHPHAEDVQILKWYEEHCQKKGFWEWKEFEHPQLGKVELGGWEAMYTWRNPPLEYLAEEAEKNLGFALSFGDFLPYLTIHTLEVNPVGDGTYQLNLVVENSGFLPTYTSEQARKVKAVRPVRAELDLPAGIQLVSGKKRVELGHLEGRSNKLDTDQLLMNSTTDNGTRCQWVLKGKPGTEFTLKLLSERAGSLERILTLP